MIAQHMHKTILSKTIQVYPRLSKTIQDYPIQDYPIHFRMIRIHIPTPLLCRTLTVIGVEEEAQKTAELVKVKMRAADGFGMSRACVRV